MERASTTPPSIDEPIRVVLVGSERVTRAGLRMLIDSQPGLRVVGEAANGGDLGAALSAGRPQIVLVDFDGAGHADLIPDVRQAGDSALRIIVLTSAPDSEECATAIQRGVLGIVSKQQAPEVLIKAIERVHAGEVWLNRTKIAGVVGNLRASAHARNQRKIDNPATLAQRERQIITLVGQGFRNNEIAATIFLSEATVRNCLGSIFKKLGISNRVHLMIYAIQEGFVNAPAANLTPSLSPRDVLRLATSAGRPPGDERQS